MTDTAKLLLTLGATVVGSGLGTTIVGALFKKRLDTQLETHKALLQRSGRIHERQVEALSLIYSSLEHALFYLQRVTSAGKFAGEDDDKLIQNMSRDLGAASEEFSKNRLLLSESLGQKLHEFFSKMVSAGVDVRMLLDPMVQGESRAKIWQKAQETAYRELPSVLDAVKNEAVRLIHG